MEISGNLNLIIQAAIAGRPEDDITNDEKFIRILGYKLLAEKEKKEKLEQRLEIYERPARP